MTNSYIEWTKFKQEATSLDELKFPRCYGRRKEMDYVYNEVRQRYWIVGGKSAVKKFSQTCLLCRRRKSRPPVMSALPEHRVTRYCPPFFNAFVDLFGLIKVKQRRKSKDGDGDLCHWSSCLLRCCRDRFLFELFLPFQKQTRLSKDCNK